MTGIQSILVVDDSKVQCAYAVEVCKHVFLNAAIYQAYAGLEALDVLSLHTTPFDLILIDLEMPGMDGVELLGVIAEKKLAKSVVILSAKDPSLISSVGVMAEADGLPVLGTIKKPLQPEVLDACKEQFLLKCNRKTPVQYECFLPEKDDIVRGIQKQEFELYYQPKLTTEGLKVKGVEALVRWQHPEYGFVPPGCFINRTEDFGLINDLTLAIFEMGLRQRKQWLDKGLKFNLSLNLSPSSLVNPDLASWIADVVDKYGFAPEDITLEVTENVLLVDVARSLNTLARLRLKGFCISIDDYGTGFANAEQLSRLPASELKIDRSIVDGSSINGQKAKILEGIVNLAKSLELTTVAEGIERIGDYLVLKEMGVDVVQGYFFARPMPNDQFLQWLKTDLKELRSLVAQHPL